MSHLLISFLILLADQLIFLTSQAILIYRIHTLYHNRKILLVISTCLFFQAAAQICIMSFSTSTTPGTCRLLPWGLGVGNSVSTGRPCTLTCMIGNAQLLSRNYVPFPWLDRVRFLLIDGPNTRYLVVILVRPLSRFCSHLLCLTSTAGYQRYSFKFYCSAYHYTNASSE